MLNLPTLALRAKTRRVKVKGRETALTYWYNIYCRAPTNGRPPPDGGYGAALPRHCILGIGADMQMSARWEIFLHSGSLCSWSSARYIGHVLPWCLPRNANC